MRRTVKKSLTVKDLFDKVGVLDEEHAAIEPEYNLRVSTPYGPKQIRKLFRTEKQDAVTCYFGNNKTLTCSNRHKLMASGEWKFVSDITQDDIIDTETGVTYLKKVNKKNNQAILYDFSVEDVHCYYTNGILSHNSWALMNVGAHAVKEGYTVLHYTLELNEAYVGLRYDSVITGIANQNLRHYKEDIKAELEKLEGELVIKHFPTKSVSVMGVRAHVEKCIMQGKKPDMIIVDYADLLRGTGTEKRHELEGIYEELRGMAGEYEIPVWTASQANRSSLEEDVIDASKVSESYGKVMVADFILSLSRKIKDKMAGTGRWHVIKNRFGPDGITLPSKMNTSNGQFDIYTDTSIDGKAAKHDMQDGNEMVRQLLSNSYRDLMNTGGSEFE